MSVLRWSMLLLVGLSDLSGVHAQPNKPELILPLGHSSVVLSVAFAPDGRSVLTGSADKTARLWDVATGKPLLTFQGHTNWVRSVVFSPDGRSVLTGSDDKTARLWDVATGKPLQTFQGHTDIVRSVAFAPDAKSVLTGSWDKTARLWDVATGKTLQTFQGHIGWVLSVVFSPDGRSVLTGSDDKTARLWDIPTGKPLHTFPGQTVTVGSMAFSPDGRSVLTGSDDNTARLWDIATGKTLHPLEGHTHRVHSVVFSPDGRSVLTGSDDKTARLWDVATGKTLQIFQGHTSGLNSVAFAPDGRSVLTGSKDKTARLWDVATGKTLQTFQGHSDYVWSVAFAPDGKSVLTGSVDTTARLWNTATGKPSQTLQGHTREILSVAFAPDGKSVLTGSWDKTARLWDIATGKTLQTFQGHTNGLNSVAFAPDGKSVLTGWWDKTARLWDVTTGRHLQSFEGHTSSVESVAFSPDGESVLTGSDDQTARLWDVSTGKPIQTFQGHTNGLNSVAFAPDGKSVLTGSWDKSARLWDVTTGKTLQTFQGHTDTIRSVSFAPDGKSVLTGSADGTARLWNAQTGEQLAAFLAGSDYHLAWTPEGYYTGSLEAEKMLAWKVSDPNDSRGFRVVGLEQFRDTFYRPDLFKHLLGEGSVVKALARADAERGVVSNPVTIASEIPPLVILREPRHLGRVEQAEIRVSAIATSVTDRPIESWRLEVNGQPSGRIQRVNVPKRGQAEVEWPRVPLQPGENTIRVFAKAGKSEGPSDVVKVTRITPERKKVRLHMLVIGISKYKIPAAQGGYKNLNQSVNDGKRFAEAFIMGGQKLYSEVLPPKMLFDEDATKDAILDAIQEFSEQMTTEDVGVIFYAGHGDRLKDRTYLTAYDTDKTKLLRTGIAASQLREILAGTKGRKYLFMDCCHAGGVLQRGDSDSLHDEITRELRTEATGMVIACACQGSEVANEDANGGYFTTALIEGLKGKAATGNNGVVYGKMLAIYVQDRVKEMTKTLSTDKQQRPLFDGPPELMDLPLTRSGAKE